LLSTFSNLKFSRTWRDNGHKQIKEGTLNKNKEIENSGWLDKTKHKIKKKEGTEKKQNGRRCREEEEEGCSGSQLRVFNII
jgi:hypothetical protein